MTRPGNPLSIAEKHGVRMSSEANTAAKRVLIVEDELMIRMLLEGMLTDLGHTVAAEAGSIEEAMALAKDADFDIAVLDVNLNGQPITPVVEVLVQRGLPFVFASGYGQRGVPEPYRSSPTLQKPFQVDALEQAIPAALYYDDLHGAPDWRRPMTLRLAEQIRQELAETAPS